MTTNQKVSININASNVDIALTSSPEAKPNRPAGRAYYII